jgi:hypothetical protein
MPSDIEITLARPEHSAELCRLFRKTPMAGSIQVAMEREPDFFQGAALHSLHSKVVIARDQDGKVIGSLCLAQRPVYVDGQVREVDFLSDVRIHPLHRQGMVLGRMIRQGRKQGLLAHGFAQCIVVRDNIPALNLIDAPRRGAPPFFAAGKYASPAIFLGRRRPSLEGDLQIRRATFEDISIMQALLDEEAPKKQFYPKYQLTELKSSPYYRGLDYGNYYLAFRGARLVGIAGIWDQSEFKQTRIVGYQGATRWLRPLFNVIAPVTGRPGLPPIGSALKHLVLHTVCIRDNYPKVFSVIFRRICNEFAMSGQAYIQCGFDASDPLLQVVSVYPRQDFGGRHFLLSFDGSAEAAIPSLRPGRPYYLEVARI